MKKTKVTVVDHGWAQIAARIHGAWRVRVGLLSNEPKKTHPGKAPTHATLLEVAAYHEFGAPMAHIPQRSFIRRTVDKYTGEIRGLLEQLAKQILLQGLEPHDAMSRLGAKVKSMIQKEIAAGILPPLKEETIERKGSSKPLIDTGQLKSAVSYKVEKPK